MRPTFIGLGAQKAASSWIYEVLKDHPQIGVSEPKELDFFSRFYEFGFQWYEGFFERCQGCIAVGEISPSYLDHTEAPHRAHAYNPGFRIIVSLRDPVDRAFSNHLHEVREGRLAGADLSFEAGLANNPSYVARSRYATHLRRWFRAFDRRQILVLFQEEIRRSPDEHAGALYRHLGVDEHYRSPFAGTQVNRSYLPKSRAREAVVRGIGGTLRLFGGRHLVESIKGMRGVRAFREANRFDVRDLVPPMAAETRTRLVDELAGEMTDLARLLGRDSLPWRSWPAAGGAPATTETVRRPEPALETQSVTR